MCWGSFFCSCSKLLHCLKLRLWLADDTEELIKRLEKMLDGKSPSPWEGEDDLDHVRAQPISLSPVSFRLGTDSFFGAGQGFSQNDRQDGVPVQVRKHHMQLVRLTLLPLLLSLQF